jgi:hypothetical protein
MCPTWADLSSVKCKNMKHEAFPRKVTYLIWKLICYKTQICVISITRDCHPSQLHPTNTNKTYFFYILIWPSHLSLVSSFYNYNNVHISYLPVHTTCPSTSPWYYPPNTTRGRIKITKFLITDFLRSVSASLSGSNIPCSSRTIWNQVSYPYKI